MPFKSKAQRRKFAELLVEGKISPETYEEWNRETGRALLPERVKKKKAKARKTSEEDDGKEDEGEEGEEEMTRRVCCIVVAALLVPCAVVAQTTVDEAVPPGNNFDKAEFRLWLPASTTPIRAMLVLVPGANGDGRPMADDPVWQTLATKHNLGIVACRFTDKPHESADAPGDKPPAEPTAWLVTERIARAWTALVNDRSFD